MAESYGGESYRAYLPNPLPPQLSIDAGLAVELSKADRAVGELAGLGRSMANPLMFIRPLMRREAVLSSRMEGTQATVRDLYAFEAGRVSLPDADPRVRQDVEEVRNYVLALEHGLGRLSDLPVSDRLLCEVHARLVEGVRGADRRPGQYRAFQVYAGIEGAPLRDADFVYPPAGEIPPLMHDLMSYVQPDVEDLPALIRLALSHYQFETIHPFVDGNGRIGRLLVSLLTVSWGLLPAPLLYLSAYLEAHRTQYISLMRQVSLAGEWREWVSFFVRGVAAEAEDACRRSKRLLDLQTEWRELLLRQERSPNPARVADSLFEFPVTDTPLVMKVCGVSRQGAAKIIARLEQAGIISHMPGSERPQRYWSRPVMDIAGGASGEA